MLTVELPWPHRDLSPNSRKHWANRATKARVARKAAHAITTKAYGGTFDNAHMVMRLRDSTVPIDIGMQFYPKDRRHYDLDGLISRMKSSLDGIADSLHVNDRRFRFSKITLEPAQKPGKVVVTISEAA